jgi:hypothetical protein
MGKYFKKDRFFYGYKAEALFQEVFPEAKKLVNGADFKLGKNLVEIGRSSWLSSHATVYYRKIHYNVDIKKRKTKWNPKKCVKYICDNPEKCVVPFDNFLFVYFNKNLKNFVTFTYKDLLSSPLKRKADGEYFFDVTTTGLVKTTRLFETVLDRIEYTQPKPIKLKMSDFGYEEDD